MKILKKSDNPKNFKNESKNKTNKLQIEGQNKGNIIKPKETKRKRVF